jgi:hypothetical protein
MTTDPYHDIKVAGDAAASVAGFITILSTWAGVLTPILSLLVLIATLGWWVIRYAEWWRTGGTKNKEDKS